VTRRLATACLLVGALVGAGAAWALAPRHWLELDGREWGEWSGTEREAWMQGYLAGHAVGRLPDSLARDSAAAVRILTGQRAAGGFSLPYASQVYTARLGDYYRWENHARTPLWRATLDVDAQLRPLR
jgi:hypothetical protein